MSALFDDLKSALEEAIAHTRGESSGVRVRDLPRAEIRPTADAKAGGHRLPFGCMAGTGQITGDITASLESERD